MLREKLQGKEGARENRCKGMFLLKGAGCTGYPPARRKGSSLLRGDEVRRGAHVYDQDCGRLRVLLRFGFPGLMGAKINFAGLRVFFRAPWKKG